MNSGTVLLLAATAMAIATVVLFNRLVLLRTRFESAFVQLDVYLMQRDEVLLRIVEKAADYMQHDSDTLTSVIQARNNARRCCENAGCDPGNDVSLDALASAEQALFNVVVRLIQLIESYPELKADSGVQHLQDELATVQSKVANSGQAFNDTVLSYNRLRQKFPAHIVSRAFCFREACCFIFSEPQIINNTSMDNGLSCQSERVRKCSG
ncbi:MAG: LemA family protein [Granulosicoccus sp.]